MMTKLELGLVAAFLVAFSGLVPSAAQAQRMAGGAAMHGPMPTARSRPAPMRTAAPRLATGTTRANAGFLGPGFAPGFGTGFGTAGLSGFGNGFGGNLGVHAAIDPATQWRNALAERFARFNRPLGGGFYLLDGGYGYATPDDATGSDPAPYQIQPGQSGQQPIIVVQQAPPQQAGNQTESAREELAAPLPDVGQFTLVLRNGAKIEAVGFTRMGDKIVYITAEGSRRTMATSDLDTKATQEVNEERGTPLQLTL
jgi:hypothetical protein